MKHLKAKLMATVMSLILATLMLTSASFAWFTISTAPEVSNIKATMEANKNLEMALDDGYDATTVPTIGVDDTSLTTNAARNYYWGNLVDLADEFGSGSTELRPVAVTGSGTGETLAFYEPQFALDGRIDGKGATALSADSGNGVKYYYGDDGLYAIEIDLWLRSNISTTVKLNSGSGLMRGDEASEQGLGTVIDGADVTYTDAAGAIIDMDTGIALTANEGQMIKVFIYVDGAHVTNADLWNSGSADGKNDISVNIQFMSDDIDAADAMSVTETGNYGRTGSGS